MLLHVVLLHFAMWSGIIMSLMAFYHGYRFTNGYENIAECTNLLTSVIIVIIDICIFIGCLI